MQILIKILSTSLILWSCLCGHCFDSLLYTTKCGVWYRTCTQHGKAISFFGGCQRLSNRMDPDFNQSSEFNQANVSARLEQKECLQYCCQNFNSSELTAEVVERCNQQHQNPYILQKAQESEWSNSWTFIFGRVVVNLFYVFLLLLSLVAIGLGIYKGYFVFIGLIVCFTYRNQQIDPSWVYIPELTSTDGTFIPKDPSLKNCLSPKCGNYACDVMVQCQHYYHYSCLQKLFNWRGQLFCIKCRNYNTVGYYICPQCKKSYLCFYPLYTIKFWKKHRLYPGKTDIFCNKCEDNAMAAAGIKKKQ